MQHCTPETLALAALREPTSEDDAAHLEGCRACRAEVASLQRGVDALAVPEFASAVAPVGPPPAVWGAIAAATGVSAVPRPDAVAASAAPAPPVAPVPDLPAGAPGVAGDATPSAPVGGPPERAHVVRELRPRRTGVLLAVAASLVLGAGVGAGSVALSDRTGDEVTPVAESPGEDPGQDGDDRPDDVDAVLATDLAPLDDRGAAGDAAVVATEDGEQLRVVLDAPAVEGGYYEVWLIEPAIERMVPVGVVRAGTTTLQLPEGIDLAEYPIVDVSVEPLDGDPTHSGVSVARGVLDS